MMSALVPLSAKWILTSCSNSERGALARFLQPGGERPPTLGGDGVAGAAASPYGVVGRFGVAVGDELLWLLVQLALGSGPQAPQAAVDLLHELVRGPGLHGQQAEDGVGRGGHRRRP